MSNSRIHSPQVPIRCAYIFVKERRRKGPYMPSISFEKKKKRSQNKKIIIIISKLL
jgi:hypothetical protein